MLALCGCTGDVTPTPASHSSNFAERHADVVVDAGIVFSDLEGYLCLTLGQIGLSSSTEIQSVSSSCDCIQPAMVEYQMANGKARHAVLLNYKREQSSLEDSTRSNSPDVAINLGVIVEVRTHDGSAHKFTVNMLRASRPKDQMQ